MLYKYGIRFLLWAVWDYDQIIEIYISVLCSTWHVGILFNILFWKKKPLCAYFTSEEQFSLNITMFTALSIFTHNRLFNNIGYLKKRKNWKNTHLKIDLHEIDFLENSKSPYFKITLCKFSMFTHEKLQLKILFICHVQFKG